MNSTSLLARASFGLLLLIFGCLVYMIVHEHRVDVERSSAAAARQEAERAAEAVAGNARETAGAPAFAPIRPRTPIAPAAPPAPRPHSPARPPLPIPPAATDDLFAPASGRAATTPADGNQFSGYAGTASAGGGPGVTGRVLLRGTPPPEKQIALDPTCGRLHRTPITTRHYVVSSDGGLANVLVYVKAGSVSTSLPVTPPALLDQAGCEYQPYVLGIQAGQTLVVRNSDPFLHNVHPVSSLSRERNVGQPVRGMTTPFIFSKSEVFVRFKCDVHPWMFAFVGVIDHPWFAVTGKDGRFTLPPGLAPGRYTLAAAHPKAGEATQDVSVTGSDMDPITFTIEVPEALAQAAP